jgi:hypothetical protein
MAKESAHIIVYMREAVELVPGFLTGLTIAQADALLINAAVNNLIGNGYPSSIEHEIIYLESYVVWPQHVVYLCIHSQE